MISMNWVALDVVLEDVADITETLDAVWSDQFAVERTI